MAKPLFRFFLAIYVFLYRLTAGKFGNEVQGLPVLLLTTTGRKTGKQRTTHSDSLSITAAMSSLAPTLGLILIRAGFIT